MPLAEQELLTFREHLSSSSFFNGFRVAQYLLFCKCFIDHCWGFCCPFTSVHGIACLLFYYTNIEVWCYTCVDLVSWSWWGNITALFKKGDKTEPGNYRPVSLTSVICKTMEQLVRETIVKHMSANKLLCNKQFGFISGRSTALQLLKVMDEWTDILDKDGKFDSMYMNFMKAFDKVPHRRLLHKMHRYKISEKVIKWVESFLSNRIQKVIVNDTESKCHQVTSRIPQGSILGPILFVIYINDMPEMVVIYLPVCWWYKNFQRNPRGKR